MVSVPINEPERERPKRTGVELFEATPDQLPPQNLEAEEVILGGILLDPDAIGRVADVLQKYGFFFCVVLVMFV
ncbi:DnaB-like helicase N-terminal domain-containing protein, partial [Synechococcus sp. Cruz CV12-2-Slac-r]|uniref:DnaB-like helicase N-terminal domain-containing protein n=1 Tax=Synechococcus sp. Cruz CV12-2-Slac-r TaxID=2823748 RepID=UPI0028F420A3